MKKLYTLLLLMCTMTLWAAAQERKPLIEDYSVLVEEQGKTYLYHYVMAYTNDGWRSSENIYRSQKSGKTFLQEELYDVGKYTYEFDTQGRVKVKDVKYEKGNMQSYRIIADYSASPVSYTKYDGDLSKIASWTCHDNGALASYTFHVDDAEAGGRAGTTVYYGENGELLSDATAYTLNEGTKEYANGEKVYYKYDGKLGRLLEHSFTDDGYTGKVIMEYDDFGRIIKVTDIDDDDWISGTFEYFNDEVYSVGNSWSDVLGFQGPLTKIVAKDKEGTTYMDLTFKRDNKGKLLNAEGSWQEWDDINFTVEDGHITSIVYSDKYGSLTYTYTWNGEDITEMQSIDKQGSYEGKDGYIYSHEPGKMVEKTYDEGEGCYVVSRIMEETDNTFSYNTEWGDRLNVIVQREDMSIKRPNIGADLAGFCPERPLLIGVNGRILCSGNIGENKDHGLVYIDNDDAGIFEARCFFINCDDDEFFNIRHEGATTTCADALDRPVFETENGRLVREYIYNDESNESNPMPAPKRMQQKKAGETNGELKDVTVITYNYNAEGLCSGQTIAVYDSDGTSEQKDVAYTYTTGIKEVTTKSTSVLPRKIIKDGRVVIVRDGNCYNVAGIEVQH